MYILLYRLKLRVIQRVDFILICEAAFLRATIYVTIPVIMAGIQAIASVFKNSTILALLQISVVVIWNNTNLNLVFEKCRFLCFVGQEVVSHIEPTAFRKAVFVGNKCG